MVSKVVPLVFVTVASVSAAQEAPMTRLRHGHRLLIYADGGQNSAVHLAAVSASSGYPDPLTFDVLSPDGESIAHGVLQPGNDETVTWDAQAAGVWTLIGDPARNAFAIDIDSRLWAIELPRGTPLQVISTARRLHFLVPTGIESFDLTLTGEAATVTILRPDGEVAATVHVPQYETVETTVPAPRDARGKPWALDLKLAEDLAITFDQAIPPYVSEVPLTAADVEKLEKSSRLADFDLRPTPSRDLTEASPAESTESLDTGDGLRFGIGADGRGASVAIGEKRAAIAPRDLQPLSGFFVRDLQRGPGLVPVSGRVRKRDNGLQLRGQAADLGLRLDAEFRAAQTHVAVSGSLRDETGDDRAISLYFALPAAADKAVWWDDIDTRVAATDRGACGNWGSSGAGANGKHSAYPFGCVCQEEAGVALGIPLTRPTLARIGYEAASQQFYLCFDFGLTKDTRKFPSRADFEFAIYACDGNWGFRSAAEKYYRLFPESFEKRMAQNGSWACWGNVADCAQPEDYAFLYHWGPAGDAAVAFDDANGLYSCLYNDSVRFFADLGEFDHRPTAEEANAVLRKLLGADDPRGFILSAPDSATGRRRFESLEASLGEEAADYFARCWGAVRISAAEGADGNLIPGYIINRQDWGPENWWTGRLFCNPDPGIPSGYGQFLIEDILQRTFRDSRANGAEYDGVGLDNYFVNANTLDFRREHFAAVDFPLTFDSGDHRPCIMGDFALWEWVAAVADWLRPEGKFIIANTGNMRFPFAAHWLDINGFEWNVERSAVIGRTLAYHKPAVTLPVKDEHYEEEWIARNHLRFAIFPGGYPSSGHFKALDAPTRAIYRKYVPIIRTLAEAGWEPVTHAWGGDLRVERFGPGSDGAVYFTVYNPSDEASETGITVDRAILPAGAQATELLSGQEVGYMTVGGGVGIGLHLGPHETQVIRFGP